MASTRRLAAIMFTDMVGSTALAQTNEAEALRLRDEQEELVRPLFAAHQGREIKSMGDGFLAEFDSALRAVQCAIDIQQRLHARNSQAGHSPLHLRIGIHLGDVEVRGTDIFGDSVNIASRIEPLAEPGGICVTDPVFGQVHNKIPNQLERLEPKALKNVRFPVDVYRLVMPWEPARVAALPPSDPKSGRTRVAVLPFANISPDANDAYIADGMTEELIARMSKISGLQVLARTSVMRYRTGERNIEEIAKELRAGTILEGSVRKSGTKVRITIQAIDSESSVHLWSESYDREMKDLFAVETDIAQTVAETLRVRLLEGEKAKVSAVPTKDSDAHALYLKGVAYNAAGYASEADLKNAIKCFERAIELDPSYASAYSWLADSYLSLFVLGAVTSERSFPLAEAAAAKALELDPGVSGAHSSLLALRFYKGDIEGAETEARKAIALDPHDTWNHSYYAGFLWQLGRLEEAHQEVRVALDLAPFDRFGTEILVYVLLEERRFEEAAGHLRRVLEFDPDFAGFHTSLGVCYMGTGRYEQAVREFARVVEIQRTDDTMSDLAWALAKLGKVEEGAKILEELIASSATRSVSSDAITQAQVALGRIDDAFALWERECSRGDWVTLYRLRTNHAYDGLRTDARFVALIRRFEQAQRSSASGSAVPPS